MNKTKTTKDKERDANHQIKRGNTQNTSEGKKKRDTDNRETTGGNLSP